MCFLYKALFLTHDHQHENERDREQKEQKRSVIRRRIVDTGIPITGCSVKSKRIGFRLRLEEVDRLDLIFIAGRIGGSVQEAAQTVAEAVGHVLTERSGGGQHEFAVRIGHALRDEMPVIAGFYDERRFKNA